VETPVINGGVTKPISETLKQWMLACEGESPSHHWVTAKLVVSVATMLSDRPAATAGASAGAGSGGATAAVGVSADDVSVDVDSVSPTQIDQLLRVLPSAAHVEPVLVPLVDCLEVRVLLSSPLSLSASLSVSFSRSR
jgi:hypothetical protein